LHNRDLHQPKLKSDEIIIGWTGTHSTLKYLKELESVFFEILDQNPQIKIIIIADKQPSLKFPFTFISWRKDTEISDLLTFDIGVMPLPNDEWAQGKCGFKILQYMALQIPAVASPVGVNSQIIRDGVSGLLCANKEEWITKLSHVINSEELRQTLGRAGFEEVRKRYSVLSNARNFLSLFE
jgi:glycosyltransferase involved in cell wall biosynthesis